MLEARSPKYPALYDPRSGVRFIRGRAEVTEEQALALAERRYVDGILIEGTPAKDWAKTRRSSGATEPDAVPALLQDGEYVVPASPPGESADAVSPPPPQNTEPTEGRRTRRSR